VWEWCADWYDEMYYARSPKDDPECRDGVQRYRVLRGGSWGYYAWFCRAAYRGWFGPARRRNYFGFRVVCCLD
jgi:formylglycine-generating enzyme required for sulfatase activity